jgi:hypothetical protein
MLLIEHNLAADAGTLIFASPFLLPDFIIFPFSSADTPSVANIGPSCMMCIQWPSRTVFGHIGETE